VPSLLPSAGGTVGFYLVLVEGAQRPPLSLCQIGGTREAKLLVCKEGERRGDQINFNCKLFKIAKPSILKNTHEILLMMEQIVIFESSNIKPANYVLWTVFLKASMLEES
jgi:hypothetical protein